MQIVSFKIKSTSELNRQIIRFWKAAHSILMYMILTIFLYFRHFKIWMLNPISTKTKQYIIWNFNECQISIQFPLVFFQISYDVFKFSIRTIGSPHHLPSSYYTVWYHHWGFPPAMNNMSDVDCCNPAGNLSKYEQNVAVKNNC